MNIWNTVFLVLVFLLAGVVVFFTSIDMKVRKTAATSIESLEKGLVDTEKKMIALNEGTAPQKPTAEKTVDELSLNELVLKLQNLVFERGKAWFGCIPADVNVEGQKLTPRQLGDNNPPTPEDRLKAIQLVEVQLTVTGPVTEHEEAKEVVPPEDLKGIVYLFNEGVPIGEAERQQEGEGGEEASKALTVREGAYLGRFTVMQQQKVQNGYLITLTAANEMNEAEIERLQNSMDSTWSVYATMPQDRYAGVFDAASPEELESLISDPAQREALLNPERPLKDFDELLTRLFQWRVVLQQDIDRSKRDIASLNSSLEIAAEEEKNLQKDINFEKKRIDAMKEQVRVLKEKADQYDEMLKSLREEIDKTQEQNEFYVAKIAEYQLKVADLIEKRADAAASGESE